MVNDVRDWAHYAVGPTLQKYAKKVSLAHGYDTPEAYLSNILMIHLLELANEGYLETEEVARLLPPKQE